MVERLRGALVRSRLPRAPPGPRLGPARGAPGHRRRRIRPGLRAPWRTSTCATGCPRSRCRCWPSPALATWPRPRTRCASWPSTSRTAGSSSSKGSPTWRPPRRPRWSPGSCASTCSARCRPPDEDDTRTVERGARRRARRPPRGARRRPRRPRHGRHHRLHPGLPGADHAVRLGHHLDPSRSRPAQPFADHAHRPGRPRPPRGARAAPPRRPHQRADRRRDQGAVAPDRDLLRGAGRQHGVPDRAAGLDEDPPGRPRHDRRLPVRRGAHPLRALRRRAGRGPSRRPGRDGAQRRARQGSRPRPGPDRRRRVGQRQRRGGGQPQRRPDGRAARRAAGLGARHDGQPPLRLQPRRRDDRLAHRRVRGRGRGRRRGSGVDDPGAVGAAQAVARVPGRQRHGRLHHAGVAAGQRPDADGVDGLAGRGQRAARGRVPDRSRSARTSSRRGPTTWPPPRGTTASTTTSSCASRGWTWPGTRASGPAARRRSWPA